MSNRDWAHEVSSRERAPMFPWSDPAEPEPSFPADHWTSSRPPTAEHERAGVVGEHVPRWARDGSVPDPGGGGRHRHDAPGEERVPVDLGWRGNGRWGAGPTGWQEPAGGEVSIPGAGWSEQYRGRRVEDPSGYVGSRRAEPVRDDPPAGPPPSRHSGPPSPRSAVWPAGVEGPLGPAGQPEEMPWQPPRLRHQRGATGEPTRRSRHSADGPRSREADPEWAARDPGAWHRPDREPAVSPDPWDASGVHGWDRPLAPGRGGWSDGGHRWSEFTDTGQWASGQPRRRDREPGAWSSPESSEGFWPGTRLSGDDPRWMGTPQSAPRSPAVPAWPGSGPAPQHRPAPAPVSSGAPVTSRGPAPVLSPGGLPGHPAAGARPRPGRVVAVPQARRIEEDLLDPDPAGGIRSLLYTVGCYLLPALAVFVWLLTLSGQAPAGCVTDLTGAGCDSPQSHAIESFVSGGPRFGLALATSLLVAVLLRRIGTTWRTATLALASSVVGGGCPRC
ncbi:hypothetical protein [Micromonospora inyonensis]|uniref:hypothetical protein n=1 Tax=Micromonospora inyonensis TaxID=47866 RepID=UPI00114CFD93|nr:hypothetical protein [Micromonospora inyonensis]